MSDHITDDKKRRLDAFQRGALLVYMRDRNHKHTEACWMEYGPSCARDGSLGSVGWSNWDNPLCTPGKVVNDADMFINAIDALSSAWIDGSRALKRKAENDATVKENLFNSALSQCRSRLSISSKLPSEFVFCRSVQAVYSTAGVAFDKHGHLGVTRPIRDWRGTTANKEASDAILKQIGLTTDDDGKTYKITDMSNSGIVDKWGKLVVSSSTSDTESPEPASSIWNPIKRYLKPSSKPVAVSSTPSAKAPG